MISLVVNGHCSADRLRCCLSVARLSWAWVARTLPSCAWRRSCHSPNGGLPALCVLAYLYLMPDPHPTFEHKLSRSALRDGQGLILIESTCLKCGSSMTVSISDGSLIEWESQHACSIAKRIPA
jgi:hypothetical protein